MRLATVAVPVPSLEALTYIVPDQFETPARGARVLVPLGKRLVTGCVLRVDDDVAQRVGTGASDQPAALKPIADILDSEAFLPDEVVDLGEWIAEYYACGPGEAIAAAMPPYSWIESEREVQITEPGLAALRDGTARGGRAQLLDRLQGGRPVRARALASLAERGAGRVVSHSRGGGRRRGVHALIASLERDGWIRTRQLLKGAASAFKTVQTATLTAQGADVAEQALAGSLNDSVRLGARQRDALQAVSGSPAGVPLPTLAARGIAPETLTRLATRGLVSIVRTQVERDPFDALERERDGWSGAAAVELNAEQRAAFERLSRRVTDGCFSVALLHGVTGSGKTEVYRRLAQVVRGLGKGVLILVPEIALTPAVAAALRRTFEGRVAVQHSGLSDGERHDQWQQIRRGAVDVVVGTRSAVFAPLPSIGLIVVDEEHDGSYKQEESPRYHGRDVAVVRAKQAGALIVLGSATPSLESYQNALKERYELLVLERRVLHRPLAHVRIVDMRDEFAANGPDIIISEPLRDGLDARLERAEQSLVLLNRRGYAVAVFCRQCAGTLECPNCSVSLTVHRAVRRARCHYCNFSMALPKACAKCAGPYLEQVGFGTERVEAEIRRLFPAARVARLDRDTVRRRGASASLLARFAKGEIDVLVGTQMIAKGHDFPRVTLVGVVSADVGLGLADFRAGERTFQLLTQVAGRAGRGEVAGEAIVQTLYPAHYSVVHACRQDYPAFFKQELEFRNAMRYPPVVALINVVVRGRSLDAAMSDATDIARRLRESRASFRVLGPAPAPLVKLKGEHRVQLLLKGTRRAEMRRALKSVVEGIADRRPRLTIDVDPLSVL